MSRLRIRLRPSRLTDFLRFAPVIAALMVLAGSNARADFSYTEDFTGTSAPGWVFSNDSGGFTPELTANTVDSPGNGWLRMTEANNDLSTSAHLDQKLDFPQSIKVGFDYAVSGGSGADGTAVFLQDASKSFDPGAFGGSLGFANRDTPNQVDGMNGGFIGVGMDTFGNFSDPTEGRNGGVGDRPDEIAVRGPGDGQTGFEYIAGTDGENTTGDGTPGSAGTSIPSINEDLQFSSRATGSTPNNFYRFEFEFDENELLTVRADFDVSDGIQLQDLFTTDFSGFTRPDQVRVGFTSSTGAQTNLHEIRNLEVTTSGEPVAINKFEWDGGNAIGDSGDSTIWGLNRNKGKNQAPAPNWVADDGSFGADGPSRNPDGNTDDVLFGPGVEDGLGIELRNAEKNSSNGKIQKNNADSKVVRNMFVTTDNAFSIEANEGQRLIFDREDDNSTSLQLSNNAELTVNAGVAIEDDFLIQQDADRTLTFNENITAEDTGDGNADAGATVNRFRVAGSGDTTINGDIVETADSGAVDITKDGGGTLTLTGSHTDRDSAAGPEGNVELNNGTIRLNNADQDNSTLRSSNIDVNGGTLLVDESDQIDDNANMTLDGGTLDLGGTQGTAETESLGTLTLNADSTIDFGGADWQLDFADSSGETWDPNATLTIENWDGIPIDGDGNDQLSFGTDNTGLTQQQLSQIRFADHPDMRVGHLNDGEVVPVPEPKFYVGGGALLALIVGSEWRRRKRGANRDQGRRGPPPATPGELEGDRA